MSDDYLMEATYFPGCTMKTGVEESNRPMKLILEKLKIKLYELEDWNCCGSSSGHAVNHEIPVAMGARNLSKAPKGRPIIIPCPNCYRNWTTAHYHLANEPATREKYENQFGRLNLSDPILNIYDLYHHVFNLARLKSVTFEGVKPLKDLKVAVYYGCGAMYPKFLRPVGPPRDTVERIMTEAGATVITWPFPHKCCSAFVSAVYPEIAEELITQIVGGAYEAGADCLVTSCAMCQMNLEMRIVSARMSNKLPVLHLNQIMALYLGEKAADHADWWKFHLIDPSPLFQKVGLWN
jgi:heterodisulfide reductase subunit B